MITANLGRLRSVDIALVQIQSSPCINIAKLTKNAKHATGYPQCFKTNCTIAQL